MFLRFFTVIGFIALIEIASSNTDINAQFYPVYTGQPPLYLAPGFYQSDRTQAKNDGATPYGYPLYFEPQWTTPDRKIGVLILHGYSAGPLQSLELQKYLYANNIASYAVRLPGHGTTIDDLKTKNYEDWIGAIPGPLAFLKSRCNEIYIYGVSLGGSLALITAAKDPDIKGVIQQGGMIKSGYNEFYLLTPITPFADFFGVDLGTFKVNADPTATHFSYPYNALRNNYQIRRTVEKERRILPDIKIPLLSIHCRTDNTADPISEYYLGGLSHTPGLKILWFGDVHTPLIHPSDPIYQEILAFLRDPGASIKTVGPYGPKDTEFVAPTDFRFVRGIGYKSTGEVVLEWPQQPGEGLHLLYDRSLGLGVVSDHLNDPLNPTFGTKATVDYLATSWRFTGEIYDEFLWRHVGYVKGSVYQGEPFKITAGYRFPILGQRYDSVMWQGQFEVAPEGSTVGINVYLLQAVRLGLGRNLSTGAFLLNLGL